MNMHSRIELRALVASTVLVAALGFSTAAFAGPPAKVAPSESGRVNVETQFRAFAKTWMDRQEASEAKMKRDASGPGATARGVSDDFKIELRPTGNAKAPYVGILRYTEQTYDCGGTNGCTERDSTRVTEIFKYQAGRWQY
jgi:hypothetical protein